MAYLVGGTQRRDAAAHQVEAFLRRLIGVSDPTLIVQNKESWAANAGESPAPRSSFRGTGRPVLVKGRRRMKKARPPTAGFTARASGDGRPSSVNLVGNSPDEALQRG